MLKEDEAQIALKGRKQALQRQIDGQFHSQAEEDRLKALEMSKLQAEKRTEKARAAAVQQLQQLKEIRDRQTAERLEQVAEGERIKRVAAEAVRESLEHEAKRHEKMLSYNHEYLRANDEQLLLKQARAAHEAKEDARILAFAAEKERLAELRRAHEATKFAAKQARFEKLLRQQVRVTCSGIAAVCVPARSRLGPLCFVAHRCAVDWCAPCSSVRSPVLPQGCGGCTHREASEGDREAYG